MSTQLIKPNYLVILPPTQHHSFFRNLPPLFFLFQYDYDNDGMHELILATADGVVVFVKNDGSFLEGETFKVGQIKCYIIM